MAEAARRFRGVTAVLFLGAAGIPVKSREHLTMTADEAVLAARAFGTRHVVPVHSEGRGPRERDFAGLGASRSATEEDVARAIFTAATDGTDQLRHVATEDIEPWVKARRETSEPEHVAYMRSQLLPTGRRIARRGATISGNPDTTGTTSAVYSNCGRGPFGAKLSRASNRHPGAFAKSATARRMYFI